MIKKFSVPFVEFVPLWPMVQRHVLFTGSLVVLVVEVLVVVVLVVVVLVVVVAEIQSIHCSAFNIIFSCTVNSNKKPLLLLELPK